MNEAEALTKMVAPDTRRKGKYREGVIQIHLTRACDKACFNCTQGSQLGGKPTFMTPEQFEQAVLSLRGYFGVVGVFGGNPAMSPHFKACCEVLRRHVPFDQRGLWCNHPRGKGRICRETFNPAVSNLNCHLDREAYREFVHDWPESRPFGLYEDCRHSPPFVAMRDVIADEGERWRLISGCDINQHWSAMIGVFRGELRAWFCEVAGAQAMLHQDETDYPDTGLDPTWIYTVPMGMNDPPLIRGSEQTGGWLWWQLAMKAFAGQVRKHCHECGVPLRGYGELAQAETGKEQTSATHAAVYRPKRTGRGVEVVTDLVQLGTGRLQRMTDYMGNAKR